MKRWWLAPLILLVICPLLMMNGGKPWRYAVANRTEGTIYNVSVSNIVHDFAYSRSVWSMPELPIGNNEFKWGYGTPFWLCVRYKDIDDKVRRKYFFHLDPRKKLRRIVFIINEDGTTKEETSPEYADESAKANEQLEIFKAFYLGQGVPKNIQEGIRWLGKAAEQGNAFAQVNFGLAHRNGTGLPIDLAQAISWFKKAVEQGNPQAHYLVGVAYKYGEGVPKEIPEAVKWFKKAAEMGDADAQFSYGNACLEGEGAVRDFNEAVKWFRRSANQGNPYAQYYLGLSYFEGTGLPKDKERCYFWTILAVKGDSPKSAELLRDVAEELDPATRARIEIEASRWKPKAELQ